ncbi:MAG: heparinase II/III family protein, partial [Candidatus Binatia bacterium]
MSREIGDYLSRATSMAPRELLQKVSVRIMRSPIETWKRLKTLVGLKQISDRLFQQALTCPLDLLLCRLDESRGPRFFVDPSDREMLVSIVHTAFPNSIGSAVKRADAICDHVFDFLGSGKVALGEKIDWHRDFKSGCRWPRRYYRDIRIVNLNDDSDIKVPWELSRFQHLITLGQAYWYTSDEKYAREFRNQLTDWISQNPPMLGVNWACTMDVAIRVVNWTWAYAYFKRSPSLTRDFKVELLKTLLSHGRFIAQNLEYGETWQDGTPLRVNSNHYLSDLVGLVYLGIMLPEFKEAKEWLQTGLEELCREMELQVYPDGVDYEASVSYHRLVTELFTSAFLLCRKNGIAVPSKLWERLEKMFEFILYYTKPDGTAPQIGDADDGRLHPLSDTLPDDHRYLLTIGAALFKRGDMKAASGLFHEEALWLLGPEGLKQFHAIPEASTPLSSKAFPQGGFYIMRHHDHYLICDVGDVGIRGRGGHGHNDTLSFELFAFDKTFIVDPGTYIYS